MVDEKLIRRAERFLDMADIRIIRVDDTNFVAIIPNGYEASNGNKASAYELKLFVAEYLMEKYSLSIGELKMRVRTLG